MAALSVRDRRARPDFGRVLAGVAKLVRVCILIVNELCISTLYIIWVAVKKMIPFWGTLNTRCRIIIGIQIRDRNFDNHPYNMHIYIYIFIYFLYLYLFIHLHIHIRIFLPPDLEGWSPQAQFFRWQRLPQEVFRDVQRVG